MRVLLMVTVLAIVTPAVAGELIRLTSGTEKWRKPSVDLSGRHLIYVSSGALFLHDVKKGDVNILAHRDVGTARISGNGRVIAFGSDGDPLGTNADGNQEIFVHDLKRATTIQVTVTTDCESSPVSIDKKGRRVAFVSDGDLRGDNPDRNDEIFLTDLADGTVTQITNTLGNTDNLSPMIAANGKYVVFSSNGDPLSTNADGNHEIFRYVVKTDTIEQLTSTTIGNCTGLSISKTGKHVLFASTSDELAGPNVDGNDELYRLFVKKGEVTRVTDQEFDSSSGTISGNGKVITYESRGDPLGTNADGSQELFQTWMKKGVWETTQITAGEQSERSRRAVLSSNGKRTFFESDADLTGEGEGTEHIFQYTR